MGYRANRATGHIFNKRTVTLFKHEIKRLELQKSRFIALINIGKYVKIHCEIK